MNSEPKHYIYVVLSLLLISSFSQAQHKSKGTLADSIFESENYGLALELYLTEALDSNNRALYKAGLTYLMLGNLQMVTKAQKLHLVHRLK